MGVYLCFLKRSQNSLSLLYCAFFLILHHFLSTEFCEIVVIPKQNDASTWWANYTTTRPVDYQVSWNEFRNAFRAHYISVGVMRKKRQEFMDLKQDGRSMHDYSKLFDHLAQYVPDQVDMDEKKDRFMIGLSTKLQEGMVLNTGGTFLEFVSNVMIVDDAIHVHKETKRGRMCQLHPKVLLQSTGRCTTTVPPTHPL
jgi:hypothetical protein